MGKYFGTDGVRGVANSDLTPELAFKLGRAAGARLALLDKTHARPFVVIGRDTRRSGGMLEGALAAGLCSVGIDVWLLGVVPTPAVAWITRHASAAAGAMISASHNPAPDNGIKFFSGEGFKLPDEVEDAIEDLLDASADALPRPTGEQLGRVEHRPDYVEKYVQALAALLPEGLSGMRVALDCAHGASASIAPRLFEQLGAKVVPIGVAPDGDNINAGVGSTHLGPLIGEMQSGGFDLGLAFDGDADRCLAIDETGKPVDGDQIMWICLSHLRRVLGSADIVATVMSNLGFEEAVRAAGGQFVRARVGDRYVLEDMQKRGIKIGGEQSGHIIFLQDNTTGDGLMTALRLVGAVRAAGKPLSALAGELTIYPQLLRNVRVRSLAGWQDVPAIQKAIAAAEARLAGNGRLLVRASGTEPLIRVMAEGKDAAIVNDVVETLAAQINEALTQPVG